MKIAILGVGNMGGATAWGLVHSRVISKEDLTVADPVEAQLKPFTRKGIRTERSNRKAAEGQDIIIVAVKPWIVESVLGEISDTLDRDRQIVVSFAAGVEGKQLIRWLDCSDKPMPPVLRVIPNLAILFGESVSLVVPLTSTPEQTRTVMNLFDKLGTAILTEERMLSAGTALSSCGLAYAMRYVRAATEGGVELGFRPEDAQNIVVQTVKGAAILLEQSHLHPEVAIDRVTTAGGVTIRGLNAMERAGFTSAVISGLKSSTDN